MLNVEVSYASSVPTLKVDRNVRIVGGADHNAVCGAGGAAYDDVLGINPSQEDRFGACGEVDDDNAAPFTTPSVPDNHMCPSSLVGTTACEPQVQLSPPSTDANNFMPANDINTPTVRTRSGLPSWPDWRGLQRATGTDYKNDDPYTGSLGGYPGGGETCVFFYEPTGTSASIYVWDHTATDVDATMVPAVGVSSFTPAVANEDCQTITTPKEPCTWTGGPPWAVSCAAGQSGCWKMVAALDGSASQDIQGTGGPLESTHPPGAGEIFQPVGDRGVPFVTGAADWNAMCSFGGPNGNLAGGTGDRGFYFDGTRFALHQDLLANDWPGNKAIHIFNNGPATTESVVLDRKLGDTGNLTEHAFVTKGSIEFRRDVFNCCPRCDCSAFPPDWTDSILGNPLYADAELKDTGYFVYAGGHVLMGASNAIKGVRGDILAASIHIGDNAKINGDLFGTHRCEVYVFGGVADCGGVFMPFAPWDNEETCDSFYIGIDDFADRTSICMEDNNTIIGSLASKGDISIREGNLIVNRQSAGTDGIVSDWGAVVSRRDVWLNKDNDIVGRVLSGRDIAMKKHNRMFWPGATSTTPNITNVELRVLPETW